jgi:hypothetical protein
MKSCDNRTVTFTVSDPWEFDSENGGSKITGQVEVEAAAALLFRATRPFTCGGKQYEFVLCTSRKQEKWLAGLGRGEPIPCNGVAVPGERLAQARQLDLGWWRGGGALVGNIRLL